jgi:hypothetical protein
MKKQRSLKPQKEPAFKLRKHSRKPRRGRRGRRLKQKPKLPQKRPPQKATSKTIGRLPLRQKMRSRIVGMLNLTRKLVLVLK